MQSKHKVTLNFFNDDATGDWGLTHADTCDNNYGNGFNAFWTGTGIFHDVFEHAHEHSKYFSGDNALNVGGEMAAMGAMWYYYDVVGLHGIRELSRNSIRSFQDNMRLTTESLIQDALYSGYCQYGDTLNSGVPKQRKTDNGELEYQIELMAKNVRGFKYDKVKGSEYFDQNEYDYAMNYKKSVTFRKIADLHRYGYRMGMKLVPDNYENRDALISFINTMTEFCKNNSAEDLQNYFRSMVFIVTKEKGVIKYDIELISIDPSEIPNIKLRNGNTIDIYEYVTFEDA